MLCVVRRDGSLVNPLPPPVERSLLNWWQGKYSALDERAANACIADLHQRSQWLSCSCTGQAVHFERPILAPAKRDGTLYLRRLPKKAGHVSSCLLWHEQQISNRSESEAAVADNSFPTEPPSFIASSIGNTSVATRGEMNADTSTGTRAERISSQAWRLMWIAEQSGWQEAPNSCTPVASLLKFAAKHQIKSTPLSKFLFCDLRCWTEGWIANAFTHCDRENIPAAAWWIQLASGYDTKQRVVTFTDAKQAAIHIPVYGEMKVFGGDASPARFPLVVLASVRRDGNSAYVDSTYAHPVLDQRRWMLVDSQLERETYADLACVAVDMKHKHGINIRIAKPIGNWNNSGERPDFVVSVSDTKNGLHHLVIETMGFTDSSYVERKRQLARNVGTEVFFDHRTAFPGSQNYELMNAIADWTVRSSRL